LFAKVFHSAKEEDVLVKCKELVLFNAKVRNDFYDDKYRSQRRFTQQRNY